MALPLDVQLVQLIRLPQHRLLQLHLVDQFLLLSEAPRPQLLQVLRHRKQRFNMITLRQQLSN